MVYKLIVKTMALRDITESLEWYLKQGGHLSEKLLIDIESTVKRLQENPQSFQKRYGEIRIAFTHTFPYGIFYTIEDNTIFVHAVLHTGRDPKTGMDRV